MSDNLALRGRVLERVLDIDEEQRFTDVFFGLLQVTGKDGVNLLFGEEVFEAKNPFDTMPELTLNRHVGERRPDARLHTERTILMIEVKTGALIEDGQLEGELADLRDEFRTHKHKRLLCLTHHRSIPETAAVLDDEDEFCWRSWYKIDGRLQNLLQSPQIDATTARIFQVLRHLLYQKGYIGYTGMDTTKLEAATDIVGERTKLIEQFQGVVNSTIAKAENELGAEMSDPEYYGANQLSFDPTQAASYTIAVFQPPVIKSNLDSNKSVTHSPFCYLSLDELTSSLKVGLSLRFNRDDPDDDYKSHDEVDANINELLNLIDTHNLLFIISRRANPESLLSSREARTPSVVIDAETGTGYDPNEMDKDIH